MSKQNSKQKSEKYEDKDIKRHKEEEKKVKKEGKQKNKLKLAERKESKKDKDRGVTTSPIEIKIPIIELEKPQFVTKEIEIDEEVSEIAKEERKITVPIIEKEKTKVELKLGAFDKNIPEIAIHDFKLKIPIVSLQRNRKVRTLVENFNADNPSIYLRIIRPPKVPLYNKKDRPEITSIVLNFDKSINALLLEKVFVNKRKEEKKIMKKEKQIPIGIEAEIDEEDKIEENLFNRFFNTKSGFPINLTEERSYIVLLAKEKNNQYIEAVKIFLDKIYRNIKGGTPQAGNVYNEKIFKKDSLRRESKLTYVIDFREKYPDYKNKLGQFDDDFFEKLDNMFLEGFGFLLIEVLHANIEELSNKIQEKKPNIIENQIITIRPIMSVNAKSFRTVPREVEVSEKVEDFNLIKMKKIATGLHRFIEPKTDKTNFDDLFLSCRNELDKIESKIIMEKIKVEGVDIPISRLVKPSPNKMQRKENKENESYLHIFLKTLIVKHYFEEKGYERIKVKTEEETEIAKDNNTPIIPDVEIIGDEEVYEVETLYGTSRPLDKIDQTVDKYKNRYKNYKINVLLTNYDVFFYYKDLVDLEKSLKDDEFNVEFKTVDLSNNKIKFIGIEEFKKRLV